MELNDLLKNPEKMKEFISMLQLFVDTGTNTDSVTKETTQKPVLLKDKKKSFANRSKKASEISVNKFESMPEFKMHKTDSIIDQKLSKYPPVDRSREFELVETTCRVCGKKESVPPSLVHEGPSRYKCNRCSATSG